MPDKKNYQEKQLSEDTKGHERLGLRIDDSKGDPTDIDETGAIEEPINGQRTWS